MQDHHRVAAVGDIHLGANDAGVCRESLAELPQSPRRIDFVGELIPLQLVPSKYRIAPISLAANTSVAELPHTALSAEVRESLYRKIEEYLMGNGLLPLFHEIDYRVAGPRVRGLKLQSTMSYVNYMEVAKAQGERTVHTRGTQGGVVQIPDTTEMTHLEPTKAFYFIEHEVFLSVFETLTRASREATILPWLASEFHPEDKGRAYRFRLAKTLSDLTRDVRHPKKMRAPVPRFRILNPLQMAPRSDLLVER